MEQIFNQPLTEVSTTRKDKLGSLRLENGVWYKYVKLVNDTSTVAGVAGDPVAYDAAGAGIAGNVVVLDLTDADAQPILAGFLMAAVAGVADTAYYLWIQISGPVTVPTAVGSGVIGSGVMLSTSDKTLTVATGVINQGGVLATSSATNNVVIARCAF